MSIQDSEQGRVYAHPPLRLPRSFDLGSIRRPTIVEIWAPGCSQCKAMRADVDEVAEWFSEQVDLKMVNAVEEPDVIRLLGARATPTLIGVREGREVVRVTGRRSRTDLYELFEAITEGGPVRRMSRQDLMLRLSAGSMLVGVGLGTGPAWPLMIIGAGLLAFGVTPLVRTRHG